MKRQETNNVPQGYKKTPVGIIPNDWDVKRLGEIGDIHSGGTPDTEKKEYWDGGILWCSPSDFADLKSKYIYSTQKSISSTGLANSSAHLLPKGTIIVTTRATIGKVAISSSEICTNQGFKNIIPHTIINPEWLFFQISHSKDRLEKLGCGSTFLEVSKSDFSKLKVCVPPLPEQQKIAEILSLWDKAIEKQSELITQLELRKKGLMQQLLTGRKRLPGFDEKWKKCKLGDICKRIVTKNSVGNTNVMTISAQQGFIKQTDFFNKTIASESIDGYYLVKRNEFCYNKSYSNGYPMGAIKRLKESEKAVVTTLYICFKLSNNKNVDIDFLEQSFDFGILNRGLTKIANEGGRAHGLLNVTPSDFFNLELHLPNYKEQKTISDVLTTADCEINNERTKLEHLRTQKRGLMQQLLTGKIRVN